MNSKPQQRSKPRRFIYWLLYIPEHVWYDNESMHGMKRRGPGAGTDAGRYSAKQIRCSSTSPSNNMHAKRRSVLSAHRITRLPPILPCAMNMHRVVYLLFSAFFSDKLYFLLGGFFHIRVFRAVVHDLLSWYFRSMHIRPKGSHFLRYLIRFDSILHPFRPCLCLASLLY